MIRSHVLICGGTGCTSSGSISIKEALEAEGKGPKTQEMPESVEKA